tara:strand:+ start:625 stop:825 length:201 start_codon:yes stop_codon:yes gene_type:complete
MLDTKTVTFKVVREETWYSAAIVPAHLNDDEVMEYIHHEVPDEVFDEMRNKYTLDTDIDVEIVETA